MSKRYQTSMSLLALAAATGIAACSGKPSAEALTKDSTQKTEASAGEVENKAPGGATGETAPASDSTAKSRMFSGAAKDTLDIKLNPGRSKFDLSQ